MEEELHDHDRGLAFDISMLVTRRRALSLVAGAGLAAFVAGCGSKSSSPSASSTTTATTAASTTSAASTSTSAAATTTAATTAATAATTTATTAAPATTGNLAAIPEETAGPYPGDGSNGVNVLNQSGIIRSDIRPSFGTSTTVAAGVPTTIELKIVKANSGTPVSGAAVYLWHCDINGNYSLYSQAVTNENYLRGVQESGADGVVTFTTIYPACYSGRWPHIHYEVYSSVNDITSASKKIATSQLALPQAVNDVVYATAGYSQSVKNAAQVSLARDNVFSDGADQETPIVTGNVTDGYIVSLTVPVNA